MTGTHRRPRPRGGARLRRASSPACASRPAATSTLVTTLLDEAGINYLSVDGAHQERRLLRGQGRRARSTAGRSTPTRCRRSPTRSASGSSPTSTATWPRSPACFDDAAGDPRRPRPGRGDRQRGAVRLRQPAPAGRRGRPRRRRRTTTCSATAPASRSAPCSSTRGRSSSTTSATRAPSPRSTPPTSTAASRWPPGCSSSPTRSSPRSATGSRRGRPTAPRADPSDPRISGQELATFLAGQYADAGWSHTDHYGWIAGLLLELGITSLDELAALLTSVDPVAIIARMGYRYPAGAVRRLDDALLAVFGEQLRRPHRQRPPACPCCGPGSRSCLNDG